MSQLAYPLPEGVDARAQLDFLKLAFGFSETKLAELFGVSRQATAQWRERGIPPERTAQVDRIVALAQFLQRRLIPQRIPQIVLTPAKGLRGKTMFAVLRERGPEPIYDYVLGLAAYANT